MNNQTSNQSGPRRRRIAGERRPRTAEGTSTAAPPKDTAATGTLTAPRPSAPSEQPARQPKAPQRRRRAEVRTPAPSRRTTGKGWWRSTTSLAVLAAALVVLLVVSGAAALGWLSWAGVDGVDDVRSGERVEAASDSAAAAAERAAAAILVYDHRRLEQDRDAATEFMTEEMASKYTETFDSVVAPAAKQTKAQVTVEVQGSAVVRGAEDRVRVLLFVDQSTTSTANADPKLALNRVEMVMVRQGGSWLVDDITSY